MFGCYVCCDFVLRLEVRLFISLCFRFHCIFQYFHICNSFLRYGSVNYASCYLGAMCHIMGFLGRLNEVFVVLFSEVCAFVYCFPWLVRSSSWPTKKFVFLLFGFLGLFVALLSPPRSLCFDFCLVVSLLRDFLSCFRHSMFIACS